MHALGCSPLIPPTPAAVWKLRVRCLLCLATALKWMTQHANLVVSTSTPICNQALIMLGMQGMDRNAVSSRGAGAASCCMVRT